MFLKNNIFKRFNTQLIKPLSVLPQSKHSISFTEPAIKKLSALAQIGDSLRIKVSSGGCHGYQYDLLLMKLSKQLHSLKHPESQEEPLVFFTLPFLDPSEDDMKSLARSFKDVNTPSPTVPFDSNNVPDVLVSIDELSLELLNNTTLDYKKELIGSQFKIVGGSMKSSCGCGSSFDI